MADEPPITNASASLPGIEVLVDLKDLIDIEAEIARKEKEAQKLQGLITGKEKKLANENFVGRAPADVVQRERDGLAELQEQLKAVNASLSVLRQQQE